MIERDQVFVPPPEAPVFEPSEEEFQDPLAYIAKIRPIAEKTGICKIRPPPDWQPPFAVDVENFKFTPRIQRLNELEAKTRIKLNFLDSIAKFWELQGCRLKIPNVHGKCLDLYSLSKIVQDEGGFEIVCKERRWSKVANRLGYPPGKGIGSQLMKHYERILWPYDVFHSGVPFDQPVQPLPEGDAKDKDYVPHGIPSRQAIKPSNTAGYSRRVKRQAPELSYLQEPLTVDISNNPELKKLQLYGPGPKFQGLGLVAQPGEKKGTEENQMMGMEQSPDGTSGEAWAKLERQNSATDPDYKEPKGAKKTPKSSPRKMDMPGTTMTMRARTGALAASFIEMYMCHTCGRGDAEDCLLLCDGCDDSFHTFCLIPPLPEVPKGDWRCPSCVAKECSKPQDPFGFETARKEYTLQTFGEMADQFKKDYFSMPVHMVPPETIEKEFWRLVMSVEDDVLVEYGADIHSLHQGSGFPTKKTKNIALEDQEYITSGWNLNNLAIQSDSVLCHINADISGMKVPWIYVGMCFSSFCWHNEDHWSYSINYLHWGEPKTWYGVPGSSAEDFEQVMKDQAPELFEAQPDLLHQLVTIMSPTILMQHNVPIVKTNQCAGEFVVTFPRAYHAGFNQGYNFAEAVNFCPADWLPMGRHCIEHYRSLSRFCVFSHEELVCKMAADPDSLDLNLAAAVYKEMLYMVEEEKRLRKELLETGTMEAEREAFELLPDDERQCERCKTTCFLSAVTCPCTPNKLVCIYHVNQLCSCHPSKHCLRYRYTLDELPAMLHNLKIRAESFDNWANKVKNALEAPQDSKLDMSQLKEMIEEADEKHFPDNDLLQQLMTAVAEAERCASVAIQLVNKKHRTRNRSSTEGKVITRLNYEELREFMEQVRSLPCEISEAELVQKLVDEVEKFQADAQDALCDAMPNSEKLRRLLEVGSSLDIELPEIPKLKLELHQARWLDDVRATLALPNSVTLETLRKLIDSGVSLAPHQAIEKAMAELQELLTVSERWEEKAKICLGAKPRHAIATVETIINEARNIPAHLPNTLALKEALRKAKDWSKQIEEIQNGEHFPYLDVLECMVMRGRSIPVRLDQLPQVESQVAAARSWRERASRTFLKKNSPYTLLEVLSPRSDIGQYLSSKARRKKQKDLERLKEQEKEYATDVDTSSQRDPAAFMATYKNGEVQEFEAINSLRDKNRRKQQLEEDGLEQGKYCVCRKNVSGFMLQCELCKDWFHTACVPLPKSSSKTKFATGAGGGTVSTSSNVQSIRDVKFLCPMCMRSRRPRLETILSLLVSLQKLPVRLPEGEALQRLTERSMSWQDRSKQALATDELSAALAKLSMMSQKMVEQAARVKTERIISAELKKAAGKTELQEHIQGITQSAYSGAAAATTAMAAVHRDSILHGMPPVPTHPEGVVKTEEDENVDVDMGVPGMMETSSVEEMVVDNPVVTSSGMDPGFASEHAYSAASKPPPAQPTKKHPRKQPLVPRTSMDISPATLELSPLARAQLEDLMVEGDLLEVSLDETQHIWRILQACQPVQQERFLEHVLEQMPPESLEKLKVKPELKEKKKMKMKRKREDIDPMSADILKMEKKKKKKEKKEKEVVTSSTSSTPMKKVMDKIKKEGKENKEKQKKRMKKRRADKLPSTSDAVAMKKKEEVKDEIIVNVVDGDDDDDDELCSAKKCLRPMGDDINWVQCDGCEKWYHLLCIGMKEQPEEDEEFICRICTKKRAMQKAAAQRAQAQAQTPGTSTTTTKPATVPSITVKKEPVEARSSSPHRLTTSSTGQQRSLTSKSAPVTHPAARVQTTTKSGGRNSPATVSSGRSSPAVMSTTKTSATVSSTGRSSPALSSSGRKSPALMSLGRKSPMSLAAGRKSPVTLTTGRNSPTTTGSGRKSPANVASGRKSPATVSTGRKSPATIVSNRSAVMNVTTSGTVVSTPSTGRSSPAPVTQTDTARSQAVPKVVEIIVPKSTSAIRVPTQTVSDLQPALGSEEQQSEKMAAVSEKKPVQVSTSSTVSQGVDLMQKETPMLSPTPQPHPSSSTPSVPSHPVKDDDTIGVEASTKSLLVVKESPTPASEVVPSGDVKCTPDSEAKQAVVSTSDTKPGLSVSVDNEHADVEMPSESLVEPGNGIGVTDAVSSAVKQDQGSTAFPQSTSDSATQLTPRLVEDAASLPDSTPTTSTSVDELPDQSCAPQTQIDTKSQPMDETDSQEMEVKLSLAKESGGDEAMSTDAPSSVEPVCPASPQTVTPSEPEPVSQSAQESSPPSITDPTSQTSSEQEECTEVVTVSQTDSESMPRSEAAPVLDTPSKPASGNVSKPTPLDAVEEPVTVQNEPTPPLPSGDSSVSQSTPVATPITTEPLPPQALVVTEPSMEDVAEMVSTTASVPSPPESSPPSLTKEPESGMPNLEASSEPQPMEVEDMPLPTITNVKEQEVTQPEPSVPMEVVEQRIEAPSVEEPVKEVEAEKSEQMETHVAMESEPSSAEAKDS